MESLWSAVNRTLYLDVAPASEPFKAWRLNRRIMTRHSLFFIKLSPPTYRIPPYIPTIARRLGFSEQQFSRGVLLLRDFPAPGDRLRYCPRCMEVSFHCVLYQLTALARCPIHDEPLLDHCRHCGAEIDGRMARPDLALRCQTCERVLVQDYAVALTTESPGDIKPLTAIWDWVARGHPASLADRWRVLPPARPADPSAALSLMLCLDKGMTVPPRQLRPPGMAICHRARAPLPWAGSALDIFETILRGRTMAGIDAFEEPTALVLQTTRSFLRNKIKSIPSSRVRRMRRRLVPGATLDRPRNEIEKEQVITLISVALMRDYLLAVLMPACADWASPSSLAVIPKSPGVPNPPPCTRQAWMFRHRIGALLRSLDLEAGVLARQFLASGVFLEKFVLKGSLAPVIEAIYNEHDSTRYIAWRSIMPLRIVRSERDPSATHGFETGDGVRSGSESVRQIR